MRRLADKQRIEDFMKAVGRAARGETRIYLTGGSSAVLHGWRPTTVDVDLKMLPERDEVYRALPDLKEKLELNIELAAPSDFVPEVPGWQDRSVFVCQEGKVSFYHYDFYAQALSKLERGHAQDVKDVQSMLGAGLIDTERLLQLFEQIESELYRYPAIDPPTFRRAVEEFIRGQG